MEFHVGPAAGIGADRNPVRAIEAGGTLNDVLLAGDAGPVDHTILTLQGDGLIGRNAQDRAGVGGVGAGDALLPVAGAITVRIGGGLGENPPTF